MFQIPLTKSPLAEKRIIFFMLKKQMIGRRAYTDSIYSPTSVVGVLPPSPPQSPKRPSTAEIELKSRTISAF